MLHRLKKLMSAIMVLGAFAAPTYADDLDILGLELGMTVGEIEGVLKAYDPAVSIQVYEATFSYSDGAKTLKTDPFVSTVSARIKKGDVTTVIDVEYSTPPEEGRAIRIDRRSFGQFPTPSEFKTLLQNKYGDPDYVPQYVSSNGFLVWEGAEGQVQCLSSSGRVSDAPYDKIDGTRWEMVRDGRRTLPQIANNDAATCRKTLIVGYQAMGLDTPIQQHYANLFDMAGALEADAETNAWINELQTQARAAASAGASTPDL